MELDRDVSFWRSHALAPATKSAYSTQLRTFLRFCKDYALSPLPASPATICRFAAFLGRSRAPSSVRQYLNVIRWLHHEFSLPNPLPSTPHLQDVLLGMKRIRGSSPHFKLPLTPAHLLAIRRLLNLSTPQDALFFAVICTCFFGLLRIGNVLHTHSPGVPKTVTLADLQFLPAGASLRISASKTIQFHDRLHTAVLPLFPNHPLCPVTALRHFLSLAGPKPHSSPLFCLAGPSPLDAASFRRRLSSLLSTLRLSPAEFSTHSLRRGGATWLLSAGVPLHLIKILGDWKSDCVLQYLRPSPAQRLQCLPVPGVQSPQHPLPSADRLSRSSSSHRQGPSAPSQAPQ